VWYAALTVVAVLAVTAAGGATPATAASDETRLRSASSVHGAQLLEFRHWHNLNTSGTQECLATWGGAVTNGTKVIQYKLRGELRRSVLVYQPHRFARQDRQF